MIPGSRVGCGTCWAELRRIDHDRAEHAGLEVTLDLADEIECSGLLRDQEEFGLFASERFHLGHLFGALPGGQPAVRTLHDPAVGGRAARGPRQL